MFGEEIHGKVSDETRGLLLDYSVGVLHTIDDLREILSFATWASTEFLLSDRQREAIEEPLQEVVKMGLLGEMLRVRVENDLHV